MNPKKEKVPSPSSKRKNLQPKRESTLSVPFGDAPNSGPFAHHSIGSFGPK